MSVKFLPLAVVVTLSCAGTADAATFCVSSTAELQSALQSAANNADSSDLIKMRSGTYLAPAGGFGRNQVFDGSDSITIEGGWINLLNNCDFHLPNSTSTIIDGQNTQPGLIINRGVGTGSTAVRRLTIKRGFQGGNTGETNRGGGIAVFTVTGSDGSTTLENLILSDNNASFIAGGAYVGGKPVIVRNNLFVGNGATSDAALSTISNASVVYLNNNTFTQNVNPSPTSYALGFNGDSAVYLSNNILWNNSGRDVFATNRTLIANIVQTLEGTLGASSNGNLNVDPRFASASDFRLQPASPAINEGANAPFGGLADRDLLGAVRVIGPAVDRGAYESERGFANGFE